MALTLSDAIIGAGNVVGGVVAVLGYIENRTARRSGKPEVVKSYRQSYSNGKLSLYRSVVRGFGIWAGIVIIFTFTAAVLIRLPYPAGMEATAVSTPLNPGPTPQATTTPPQLAAPNTAAELQLSPETNAASNAGPNGTENLSTLKHKLGETEGMRRFSILKEEMKILPAKIKMSVADAMDLLRGIPDPVERYDLISSAILTRLPQPVQAADAVILLDGIPRLNRLNLLYRLAPCIGRPLTDTQEANIVGDVPPSNREDVLGWLHGSLACSLSYSK